MERVITSTLGAHYLTSASSANSSLIALRLTHVTRLDSHYYLRSPNIFSEHLIENWRATNFRNLVILENATAQPIFGATDPWKSSICRQAVANQKRK